jgi:UDP-GlcNAc:undecaprenyl-phosphate/decaprenyl-phosphate GlcNAc-1-phosphate transferase
MIPIQLIYLTVGFTLALGISLYALRIVVHVVKKLNFFDTPCNRSSAEQPVPTLGGIAIFFSFAFTTSIVLSGYDMPELLYIITSAMLIFFVGLKDDVVTLPPYKKIISQIVAAFIIIFLAKIRFTNLHGLLGFGEIGMVPGVLITCFTIVVIINAFNLMDGIDGLAAGLSILATTILGTWFFLGGYFNYALLSFTLVGAIGGFFYYNVYGKQYKIFMGDTGSLVLGTLVSILIIRFNEFNIDKTQSYSIQSVPAISFAILAYPLIDTLRVMVIRIINRRSPFSADKNHFHHRLLTLGFSHKKATYTIIGINLLFILFTFTLHRLGFLRLTVYISIICGFLFMIPAYFIRRGNLIRKNDPVQQLLTPQTFFEMQRNKKYLADSQQKRAEVQQVKKQTFLQRFNLW